MRRKKFPTNEEKLPTEVLERIHSDIMGPIKPESLGRKRFIITFIDEGSRYVTAVVMAKKSEALDHFRTFKEQME